jgi:response regulator NasT
VADGADRATRVVIAEDEAIIRLDLKELLEEEGYAVVGETGRGDEAIELVRSLEPDLVILDIKMPGLDGLSAARHVAGERMAAVLILTAFSQRDLVEQARDAGALAYLVKPFQKSDLIPAIEIALGRFAELAALEREVGDLHDRLEARKIVDRAKGRLMDDGAMTEQAAWRFLQQQAMASRRTIADVARQVVDGELTP